MPDQPKRHIAIIGGTFDPFHLGHLAMGEAITQQFPFDEIQYMPCKTPSFNKFPTATPKQRLKMIKLGIAKHKKLTINEMELHRPGVSYTFDTVKTLRTQHPDAAISWVMGADTLQYFNQWLHWFTILNYVHLLVINRPGYLLTRVSWLENLLKQHQTFKPTTLTNSFSGSIYINDLITPHISSSDIRLLCRNHQPYAKLVPEAVFDYIEKNNLYLS